MVVEMRPHRPRPGDPGTGGHDELVLDVQFDGDPFIVTLHLPPGSAPQLVSGQFVSVRSLWSGDLVVEVDPTVPP